MIDLECWSREKAWLLGAFFGDGYSNNKKGKRNVCFVSADLDLVEKVAFLLGRDSSDVKVKKDSNCYTVSVGNIRLTEWLALYGMDRKKNYKLRWPKNLDKLGDIPDEFIPDFVRGLWDTDGNVEFLDKKVGGRINSLRVSLTMAQTELIDNVVKCFPLLMREEDVVSHGVYKGVSYPKARRSGEKAIEFVKIIYEDAPEHIRCDRKFNICSSSIKWWEENVGSCSICGRTPVKKGEKCKYCKRFVWEGRVCSSCGKRDRKIVAKGLCRNCYQKDWKSKKNIGCSFETWCKETIPNIELGGGLIRCGDLNLRFIDMTSSRGIMYLSKRNRCSDNTIEIFSSDWTKREESWKSLIKVKLGLFSRRLYARKCELRSVSKKEAIDFFEGNHVQGSNYLGIYFFGLFFKDELVGAISLGRHNRKIDQNRIVLDRLCFKNGVQVVGGASRLFKACLEKAAEVGYTSIISFSDNRWSDGKIYKVLNFVCDKKYGSDYFYLKDGVVFSKQSQKKDACGCPSNMTEFEWAEERGLIRCYDLGKIRWCVRLGDRSTNLCDIKLAC